MTTPHNDPTRPPGQGFIGSLRILSGAMIGALLVLGVAIVVMAPDVEMPATWMLLALGVVLLAALATSEVLLRRLAPLEPGEGLTAPARQRLQATHITRLAVLEAPAIMALMFAFVSRPASWVIYAIVAVPVVALMLLLVFPHRAVLERYQAVLDSRGGRSRLVEDLLEAGQSRP